MSKLRNRAGAVQRPVSRLNATQTQQQTNSHGGLHSAREWQPAIQHQEKHDLNRIGQNRPNPQ